MRIQTSNGEIEIHFKIWLVFLLIIGSFIAGYIISFSQGIKFCEDTVINILKRIANNEIPLNKLFEKINQYKV